FILGRWQPSTERIGILVAIGSTLDQLYKVAEEQSPDRTRGRRKEDLVYCEQQNYLSKGSKQTEGIHFHIIGILIIKIILSFDKEIQSFTRTWLFLRRVHAERAIHTHSSVAQVSQARPILTTRGRPIASSSVAM
ncbi:hypothetical protein ACJX0J_040012, partial [Zea mays]